MSDDRFCGASAEFKATRRGYPEADFNVNAAMPAVDWTLQPFDVVAAASIGAGAQWVRVVGFTVPGSQYGMLEAFGQDADANGTYQTTRWRITVNSEVKGQIYPALVQVAGITAATMCPFQVFLGPGDTVALEAWDTAVGAETVRGRLRGTVRASGMVAR